MQKKNRTKYNYRKDPENLKQIQIWKQCKFCQTQELLKICKFDWESNPKTSERKRKKENKLNKQISSKASYQNDDNCCVSSKWDWGFSSFFRSQISVQKMGTLRLLLCFSFFTLYLRFLHFLLISYFLFLWPMTKKRKEISFV